MKSSWSKLNSRIEIRAKQPTITRKKLPNPVNPTKKTTGNIGVGSFSAHVDLMQLLRHIILSSFKNHHLSSCVFFSRIPTTEWGGCTVDVVKAKKHLSTRNLRKRGVSTKKQVSRSYKLPSWSVSLDYGLFYSFLTFWCGFHSDAFLLVLSLWITFLWSTSMFGVLLLVCLSSLLQIFFCLVCSYRYHVSFQTTNLRLRKPTHRIHVLYGIFTCIYHKF